MRYLLLLLAILFSYQTFSQKFTITGYITDIENGEKLIGANVYDANTYSGGATNAYGFYSLTLNKGKVLLTVSYVGYSTFKKEINLDQNISLNIELTPTIEIEEVLVEGQSNVGNVESSQMSVMSIPMKTIKNLPSFLGETDIIKAIQLLPGVQSGSEGMSGMYVRGGGPDQNLILLDGVPVYNASHLFGFFSVFNPDAIQDVKLIKGGFPARYGGRLSSVLDISMKEGSSKKFQGAASIGLISSKLTLEGPIGQNTSFIVSGRRTYGDILIAPIVALVGTMEGIEKLRLGYYFYDLNAKINHKFSNRSRLYLSAYMGKDRFYMKLKEDNDKMDTELWWGNITGSLRWNYMINQKLFLNTTVTASRYKMLIGESSEYESYDYQGNEPERINFSINYNSGIYDYAAKADFDYFLSTNHTIKFGASETYHTYNPGVFSSLYTETNNAESKMEFGNNKIFAHELGVYAEDDMKIGNILKINAGLHWSGFSLKKVFYNALEPRVSARVLINPQWSVKASYAKMNQYINLLTNAGVGLPTDLWLPATELIKPQLSHQVAAGSVYEITNDIDVSLEGYYKTMDNVIEYKDGASYFSFEDNWEEKINMGQGWAYGLELLVRKKYGPITGWVGYTWSKTERQFNRPGMELSYGKPFPYTYDRRHDISIVATYKQSEKVDIGLVWVYGTGNATTLGYELYPSDDIVNQNNQNYYYDYNYITYYESRNNWRMPAYHRLDLSVNFRKKLKWADRTLSVSIYNVYNRQNPYFVMWHNFNNAGKYNLYQYSIFPIIPSVSYSVKF